MGERERNRLEGTKSKGEEKVTGSSVRGESRSVENARGEKREDEENMRREGWGDKGWGRREEKVEAGADKFYCVSFRPLHLSALFRVERASCLLLLRSLSLSLTAPRVKEETRDDDVCPALLNRYSRNGRVTRLVTLEDGITRRGNHRSLGFLRFVARGRRPPSPPPRHPSPRDAGGVQKGDTLYENYITQAD